MYIASQKLMRDYDLKLLDKGYLIEDLIHIASLTLLRHVSQYERLCIVAGVGNNGADALALVDQCQNKHIDLFIVGDLNRASPGFLFYYEKVQKSPIKVTHYTPEMKDYLLNCIERCDLIIDGIFGTGLNRAPLSDVISVIRCLNAMHNKTVISIDIPSGLNCNTGIPFSECVQATKTITFVAMKDAFLFPHSKKYTGMVIIEDLGFPGIENEVGLYNLDTFVHISSLIRERDFFNHKGTQGRCAIFAGSQQYPGASLLCTHSCLVSGAGYTDLITVPEIKQFILTTSPEVLFHDRSEFNYDSLTKYQSILLGCGIGLNEEAEALCQHIILTSHQPLLIDADALTLLSRHMEWLKERQHNTILTPHLGEFKRLTHTMSDDVLSIAKDFAKMYNVVLVLKGPLTIVTDGVNSYRIKAGNKAMAVAGMGDVLSGIIASLLAQGYSCLDAARLGVFIHGYAGDYIAQEQYTVIPSHVIKTVPYIMKRILNNHPIPMERHIKGAIK